MLFKGQKIGKYQVLEAIGSGGFGSVYLAKDTWIGKHVALKIPHKQGEDVEKLLKEPRLLAALDHPHIVTVITAEKTNELFYIVMEYVDGTSLEQLIRKQRKLDVKQGLIWFLQICDALGYAHGKKVIHRDIRPANVLISLDHLVKVTDFGTSRFLIENQFASTRVGSPPYMAPEHFSGRATLQSDIYSLGVLMYECLAGRLPFFDTNPAKVAQMAREGNVKAPHHHNSAIPLELSQVILKSMAPALSQRYAAVEDVATALRKIQASQSQSSQDLAHLVEVESGPVVVAATPRRETRHMGNLFCWNCGRPISKRTQSCPHCDVQQY